MTQYEYWSPQKIASSGRYCLSIGQIRHLLLFRHRNGLEKAVRKVGKRLLLRIDLFDQWIESYGKGEK
ncbi:MAG: hypothetical protein KDK50_05305 [Chlamydiia bacterium]|nr:hypothetical protein [Chlamydiia bacterium]